MSLLPISVIIPTYCRPALTAQALRSVYGQTASPTEVLIIDDGSPQESFAYLQTLCQEVLESFPQAKLQLRFKHLQQNCAMPGALRNIAMHMAKCPWWSFLDSDDIWLPQKLARQWQILTENRVWIVHCRELWLRYFPQAAAKKPMQLQVFSAALSQHLSFSKPQLQQLVAELLLPPSNCKQSTWLPDSEPESHGIAKIVSQKKHKHLRQGKPAQLWPNALKKCILGPSTVLMHKSIADAIGYFSPCIQIAEDYEYFLRIIAQYSVAYCPDYLIAKRDNIVAALRGNISACGLNKRNDSELASSSSIQPGSQLSHIYSWIEPLRIEALETLLYSRRSLRLLSSEQRASAVIELQRKLRICLAGAQKSFAHLATLPAHLASAQHERWRIQQEITIYQSKLAYWEQTRTAP